MTCTVYQTNKKTGVTYAYESESYRDPVTRKPKSRRVYLGRVDPETNKIIPKGVDGKRNRSKLGNAPAKGVLPSEVGEALAQLREQVAGLNQTLVRLRAREENYRKALETALDALGTMQEVAGTIKRALAQQTE